VLTLEQDLDLEVTFHEHTEDFQSLEEFKQLLEESKVTISILETRDMFLTWDQIQKLAFYIQRFASESYSFE